jgi:hypothetical protein
VGYPLHVLRGGLGAQINAEMLADEIKHSPDLRDFCSEMTFSCKSSFVRPSDCDAWRFWLMRTGAARKLDSKSRSGAPAPQSGRRIRQIANASTRGMTHVC